MDDQEETLVLNYLEEDFGTPTEIDPEPSVTPKSNGSFDENQNAKIKDETVKATPKSLKVVLEKKTLSNSMNGKKKRRIMSPPSGVKFNGLKSSLTKNVSQKGIKNTKNCDRNDNIDDTVIKVENFDDDIEARPNLNVNATIDVKYETVQQIHTEFKYESLSETEENIRKKKKAANTPKNLRPVAGQTTLDNFFKVVDLKLKCKFPSANVFKCKHCLYVGNSRANLERHLLIHMDPDDILWYKCTECEYKSKYEHQLKSHSLIHKNPDEIAYFQCPHCELKCSRKHNLTNHIKSIHADRINSFRCADCNYSTFSKDRLVAHVKKHSKEVFTCKLCKFVTKRKEYLESHFKFKHTAIERPFPCDTCSYKGKTKRELDRHYDRMHNKEKLNEYKCNICNFSSIYKKNLEFHLLHMHQNSEGFQKFICGHCDKEFAYKNGLKTHIVRIHLKLTEDDWHKCQECKYKCKDVNTLKRHIKRNHGAPKLRCKQCNFATNRQKSMIAHMKTHEVDADLILKCPECPYRIIQSVSFTYHMKVLHGKPIGAKDIPKYYLKDD